MLEIISQVIGAFWLPCITKPLKITGLENGLDAYLGAVIHNVTDTKCISIVFLCLDLNVVYKLFFRQQLCSQAVESSPEVLLDRTAI